ncbi:MAG: hypothetical protein ACRBBR_09145 [Cellvibrionaceae bacterium]
MGSTATGAIATAALTLYFIATPTGWITTLALGAVAAGGSFAIGKTSAIVYDKFFNRHDLVNMSGVDKLCR